MIQLIYWTRDHRGRVIHLTPGEDVYQRLRLLRRRGVTSADVWVVDDLDARLFTVGGIEPIEGADDARIKYQIWADKDAWSHDRW